MSIFHERLKILKDQSRQTQVEIATLLDITPQTLSYYFNGREPSYDILIKLAKFFNVSTDYLLGISNNKNNEAVIKINNNQSKIVKFLDENSIFRVSILEFIDNVKTDKLSELEKDEIIKNLACLIGLYDSAIYKLSELKSKINLNPDEFEMMEKLFEVNTPLGGVDFKSTFAQASISTLKFAMNTVIQNISDFLFAEYPEEMPIDENGQYMLINKDFFDQD